MQHTLLGLAIACIVALLAALFGPSFVDWNKHRAFFEQEASRLVGLKVRVAGPIKVTLLPVPSVKLGDIALGPEGQGSGLRARSLGLELGLSPLLRGEFRATELQLDAPELAAGLNRNGQVDWPAVSVAAETLSIERLRIDDGRLVLRDARTGSQRVLQQVSFRGEVRSLVGPVRGKGAFVTGGQLYGYTVSTGRYGDDGFRFKLTLDDTDWPLTTELDGLLAFERNVPRFEGALTFVRPAVLQAGRSGSSLTEPWRLTSTVNATAQAARLEQISFQYGPEERAARLAGSAVLDFTGQAGLDGALTARQIDIDRLIATPDAPRRPPLSAIQTFADTFAGALRPGLPVKLTIGVDALTIGGATLQGVGADLRSDGKLWNLEKLDLRAPGFTQVRLSGKLDPSAQALGFSGETRIDANDPRALISWLAGLPPPPSAVKPWQLQGHVTLAPDRVLVERLRSDFDRSVLEGRLAYILSRGARPARLEAELTAGELDLDALQSFAESALPGTGLEWPREVVLGAEIGKAKIAGFEAQNTKARLKFDAAGIAIERFSVADFGSAKIDASGRIQTGATSGGAITVDLDARELKGVTALADKVSRRLGDFIRLVAATQGTAKLRGTVSLERAGDDAVGKLTVSGHVGAIRLALNAGATGKPDAFSPTDLRILESTNVSIDGRLDADDAGTLLSLAGLNRLVAGGGRPGALTFNGKGPLSSALVMDARFDAGVIDVRAKAALRASADDVARLELDQIKGTVAGSAVGGKLAVAFGESARIEGALATDTMDVPAVVAALLGVPQTKSGTDDPGWSAEPFVSSVAGFNGRVELKAQRADLAPALVANALRGAVRFGESQIVFEEFAAELNGGRLEGRLAATATPNEGLKARGRLGLAGADARALLASVNASVSGKLALETEIEGAGLSPAAFIGSLTGQGHVRLSDASIGGLNPRVFDAVIRAVDIGMKPDAGRIAEFVTTALDTASLPIKQIEVPVAIAAGRARLGPVSIQAGGADVQASGTLNLVNGALDSQLTLVGSSYGDGSVHPTIAIALRGPLSSASRSIDAKPLATWLALRAVDLEAKRLDTVERARREALAQPPAEPTREATAISGAIATDAPVPPVTEKLPPLPAPLTVLPAPRPRVEAQPAPPRHVAPRPAPPRNPAPIGRPLDLLGAQP